MDVNGSKITLVGSTDDCDFNTIQEALDNVEENSVIQVKPGIYNEHLSFTKKVHLIGCKESIKDKSSTELPIVVLDSDKSCEIDVPIEIEGIVFTHKKDIVFDSLDSFIKTSLEFEDKEAEEFYTLFLINSESCLKNIAILCPEEYGITLSGSKATVKDSFIHHSKSSGIYIVKCAEPTINNCIISDSNFTGIRISDSASPKIEYCKIEKCKNIGIRSEGTSIPNIIFCEIKDTMLGVNITESSSGIYENCNIHLNRMGMIIRDMSFPHIDKCVIFNNEVVGISSGDESRPFIEDCEIFSNLHNGIDANGASNPQILKCEIYNNGEVGIAFKGKSNGEVRLCDLHKNTNGIMFLESSRGLCENLLVYDCKAFGGLIKTNEQIVIWKSKFLLNNTGIIVQDGVLEVKESEIFNNLDAGVRIYSKLQGIYEDCIICDNGYGVSICSSAELNFETCEVIDNSKGNIGHPAKDLANLLYNLDKEQ